MPALAAVFMGLCYFVVVLIWEETAPTFPSEAKLTDSNRQTPYMATSEVRTGYEEVIGLAAGVSCVMEASRQAQLLLAEGQLLAVCMEPHGPLPRYWGLV